MARRTKIESFDSMLSFCETDRRSMIRCAVRSSTIYKHHYILLGHTWDERHEHFFIIHYFRETKNGRVLEERYSRAQLENDIRNGLYVLEDDTYPQDEVQFDEAYDRFEKRDGEQCFDLLTNNCEHLANFIMTGFAFSDQIKYLSWSGRFLSLFVDSSSMSWLPSSSSISNNSLSSRMGRKLPSDKTNFVSKLLVLLVYFFFFLLSLCPSIFSLSMEYFNTIPMLRNTQDFHILCIVFLLFYSMSFRIIVKKISQSMYKKVKIWLKSYLFNLLLGRVFKRSVSSPIYLFFTLIVFIITIFILMLIYWRTCWIIIDNSTTRNSTTTPSPNQFVDHLLNSLVSCVSSLRFTLSINVLS